MFPIFRTPLKKIANPQNASENSGLLTGRWYDVTILTFSCKQLYTRSIVCNKVYECVSITLLKVDVSEFHWCFVYSLIITSLQFSSWHLNDKLNNAPCADEYGEHKMNEDDTSYVKCLQKWTYTERNEACLMLTQISSQTFLSSVCLMSVSLTDNKWKETLGYQIKMKHQI